VVVALTTREEPEVPVEEKMARVLGGTGVLFVKVLMVLALLGFSGMSFALAQGSRAAEQGARATELRTAVDHYQKAVQWFPWESSWQDELGKRLMMDPRLAPQARFAESFRHLDSASRFYRLDPFPFLHLARLYAATGDKKLLVLAEEEYRKSLALSPNYPFARFELGALLFNQGDFPKARVEWLAALGCEPYFVGAIYGVGLTYERTRDKKNAEKWFNRARQIEAMSLKPQTEYEEQLFYVPKDMVPSPKSKEGKEK
jgi:tetratricopeptide (TPR) repeat protein